MLDPFARVGFACESLKVTTRIMHIVAWLLTQRAIESGEILGRGGHRPERRLGNAQDSDPAVVEQLPASARQLINVSADLFARVRRLDEGTVENDVPQSPARALMGRLERGLTGGST
jgi:regulator of CtrA degradation